MGQAWCKDKTARAQNSKSPLDRAFLRCAHRIYPNFKEDGSIFDGPTERVTSSSEIGYASSQAHSILTRGHSIDSVDRPFHPSEWVDVNLEVPGTPRTNPMLAHLDVDLRNRSPVPPPRKRKNKERPRSPKRRHRPFLFENAPKQREEKNSHNYSLHSSTKCDKFKLEEDPSLVLERRANESKINGDAGGIIIPIDIVSEENGPLDKGNCEVEGHRRRRRCRRRRRRQQRQVSGERLSCKFSPLDQRTNNYSTCSLPNYDEFTGISLRQNTISKFRNMSTGNIISQVDNPEWKKKRTDGNGNVSYLYETENWIPGFALGAAAFNDFANSAEPPLKHESSLRTSTPMEDAIGDDSISKLDEWFQERNKSPSSTKSGDGEFHTALADGTNLENSLQEILSSERQVFASFERLHLGRCSFKEIVRSISEESLPQGMLENDDVEDDAVDAEQLSEQEDDDLLQGETDFCTKGKFTWIDHPITPPSSPELSMNKAKNDNESHHHSPPNLYKLQNALSSMLGEKDDEDNHGLVVSEVATQADQHANEDASDETTADSVMDRNEKSKCQLEIVGFNFKKKLDSEHEDSMTVDGPEKPSRTRRIASEDEHKNHVPTPPRRKNRSST